MHSLCKSKTQQKKTAKETADDKVHGSRIAMDLTWCADGTAAGNECMMAMIDCETDKAWSWLLKRKDDVPQTGLKFTDELVGMGKGLPAF